MNRREFLRMAAGAAAALRLGLAKLPETATQEPDTLWGFPIEYKRIGPRIGNIKCGRYEDIALGLGALDPLIWNVRVIYTAEDEEPSIADFRIPAKYTRQFLKDGHVRVPVDETEWLSPLSFAENVEEA